MSTATSTAALEIERLDRADLIHGFSTLSAQASGDVIVIENATGLRVTDPEAAQAAGVPVMFLLVFTSSAFVPSASMPGWLQAFGTHQPVDALVTAERDLILGGGATAPDVLISLAWTAGILLAFALLSARIYARIGR